MFCFIYKTCILDHKASWCDCCKCVNNKYRIDLMLVFYC